MDPKLLTKSAVFSLMAIMLSSALAISQMLGQAYAEVGDIVDTIDLDSLIDPVEVFCSIGVAFDGTNLYVDACGDPNIYAIDADGGLVDTFDVVDAGSAVDPNAMAFDSKRNGIWFGGQSCVFGADAASTGMPIYFWDFDDDSVTQMFIISSSLINPATGSSFLFFCFTDGLAYNENDPESDDDDEIWFSDDVNPNLGVFSPSGSLIAGHDASDIDPSLSSNSGLAIGGDNLYLGNNGGGDVFVADRETLTLIDQFVSDDDRQEDMECDPNTFAPTEVMWVRTTPQGGAFPNVLTAYEIESGTCGAGGLPPPSESNYDLNLFEGVDPSDLVLDLGQEATAVAETDDTTVTQVEFKWINPSATVVDTEIVPLTLGSAESMFTPDQVGTWTVVADFGNGVVVVKTLDIDFLVIPESPIGIAALMASSLAALGAFMFLRRRSSNTGMTGLGI